MRSGYSRCSETSFHLMKYLIKSDIGYWIIVVLLTATGCSGSEKTVSQSYALSAPSEIIAEQIDDCRVKISWQDNSEGESGFSVWLKENAGDYPVRIGFTAQNAEQYMISTGLESGKSYYFGVRADGRTRNEDSEIAYSPQFTFRDLTLPSATFVGNPVSTASCIAFEYSLQNRDKTSNAICGICWSSDGKPTIQEAHQDGPAIVSEGTTIQQVVSNVLLDYGKSYNFRVYLKSGGETYYSDVLTASLGAEPKPIVLSWTKLATTTLPAEISVYETTDKLNGGNFHAWYAIADLSKGTVGLRVNIPSALTTIDQQAASFNGDCYVMTNGGYFYSTNHVGLAYVNSSPVGYVPDVQGSLRNDAENKVLYHVTRGIFGVDASEKPAVYWAGSANGAHYFFERPLPSIKGEAKYSVVSSVNPTVHSVWNPRYAIGAGPILLKNGKCPFDFTETGKGTEYYLNNYEIIPYDIFGTAVTPDRTAVGRTADGRVILFICDGRIPASGGATLTELAMILKGLGCVDALNLDGGGSTGMMVGSKHVNDQTGGNRKVKSTIGFFKK